MLQRVSVIVKQAVPQRASAVKACKSRNSLAKSPRVSTSSLWSFSSLTSPSHDLYSLKSQRKRMYSTETEVKEVPEELVAPVEAQQNSSEDEVLAKTLKGKSKKAYDTRLDLNIEMNDLRKRGDFVGAVDIYKRLVKLEIDPDHYTYTQILNLYALLKRPTSAELIWDKMMAAVEKAAANPDWDLSMAPQKVTLPTVNAMIHVYCQSSDIAKALKLYEEASSRWGLKPDAATIQPILWYYAEKRDVPAVERLYFDFKQRNPDWIPSVRLYTLLIGMYGKAQQYHQIARLLEEIKTNEIKLDTTSVAIILTALICTDEAITSDLIMKLSDMSALDAPFSVIAGDLTTYDEALTLLASMKAAGTPVTIGLLNKLLDRVVKTYKEGREFVEMMETEYEVKPNGATFDTLLQLAATPAHRSRMGDVADVSKAINDRGILPNEATMCLMIRFYSQIGEKSMAEEVLEMLKSHNPILSKMTHNAVIRMYAFGGPYEKLLAALKNVQDSKVELAPGTVDIMFQSMMRRGKYLDCANMLTHMIHARQRVQMKHIITLFANTLARIGRTDVTAEFYHYKQYHANSANPYTEAESNTKSVKAPKEERTPSQIFGDVNLIMNLHTVLNDTPGVLLRAPAEYFAHVLSAAENKGIGFLCQVMYSALRSQLPAEDRTSVFVEFLKSVSTLSFSYAHDIEAWKQKLEGEGRTNPLIQSQFLTFVKYVHNTSKSSTTGSRVNRPQV